MAHDPSPRARCAHLDGLSGWLRLRSAAESSACFSRSTSFSCCSSCDCSSSFMPCSSECRRFGGRLLEQGRDGSGGSRAGHACAACSVQHAHQHDARAVTVEHTLLTHRSAALSQTRSPLLSLDCQPPRPPTHLQYLVAALQRLQRLQLLAQHGNLLLHLVELGLHGRLVCGAATSATRDTCVWSGGQPFPAAGRTRIGQRPQTAKPASSPAAAPSANRLAHLLALAVPLLRNLVGLLLLGGLVAAFAAAATLC